jgi:integrase
MSVYKDEKQKTWYAVFRYIDWTGQKKQKMKRGFKTKREALDYEVEYRRTVAADMDMMMKSFVDIYFEDKKNELKTSSIKNKKHMIEKHIIPYFGDKKMNAITPADIIQWQNIIHEKKLSKTYERMLQNQLNALLNHAQRIYNLQNNPCKKVKKMGKSDADKLDFWTKTEYEEFIASVEKGSESYLIFEILFWTGIREGELLSITPADVDMENNLLHISKTYHRIERKDVIDTPKTETSIRTIHIPNFLKEEIKQYIEKYYAMPDTERLFPIVARTLQKRLKTYIEKSGVKPIRVHDLRHSHVAYLINQGVEPLIIKERLGHKDIKITLNTYGHLYPSQQRQVADMLDEKRCE